MAGTDKVYSSDYGVDQVYENEPTVLTTTVPARVGPTNGSVTVTFPHAQSSFAEWDMRWSTDGSQYFESGATDYSTYGPFDYVFNSVYSTTSNLVMYFENTSLSSRSITISLFRILP